MTYEPKVTGTKVCSRCSECKSVLAFGADPRHSDGLQSHCRDCHNLTNKRYSVRNRREHRPTYDRVYPD